MDYRNKYDSGNEVDVNEIKEPENVASLVINYFKQLPGKKLLIYLFYLFFCLIYLFLFLLFFI